jgi:hypothetical protein
VLERPTRRETWAFTFANEKAPTMLVELRGTGAQTVIPPSVYIGPEYANGNPYGEALHWETSADGELARLPTDELRAACGRVAASALLALHWPGKGTRDGAAMALAGMLLRAGWSQDEADHFARLTSRLAGDEEWQDRGKAEGTARKLAAGSKVTGAPAVSDAAARRRARGQAGARMAWGEGIYHARRRYEERKIRRKVR